MTRRPGDSVDVPLSLESAQAVLSSIQEGVVVYDSELRFQIWNSIMEDLSGVPAENVIGRRLLDVFPELEDQGVPERLVRALAGESLTTADAWFEVGATGRTGWVTARYDPLRDATGEIVGVVSIVQDINERKQAELALAESERLLAIYADIGEVFLTSTDEEMYEKVLAVVLKALDSRQGVFGFIDSDGSLVCPSTAQDIFKQRETPDRTVVFPRESWGGTWGRSLRTMLPVLSNTAGQVPDGHLGIDRSIFVPITDQDELIGLLAVANRESDYTDEDQELMESIVGRIGPILHARQDRDREERKRLRALEEKDALLREVHHRVKNNMAVISSLVSLQSDDLGGRETADVLNRVRGRIRAMALVHEQIYRSGDFREIDLGEYAENLVAVLFQTRGDLFGRVELETRISDVAVALDLAIPCGLILNELISNSLEHAFPDDRRGKVVVALDHCADRCAELRVVDDGIGADDGADLRTGFGLQLVDLLGRQLDGEIKMSFSDGADVRVRFPLEDR